MIPIVWRIIDAEAGMKVTFPSVSIEMLLTVKI